MEQRYVQFLYFLKECENERIKNAYKVLKDAGFKLKTETKEAIALFYNVLDTFNSVIAENKNISDIYAYYKSQHFIDDELLNNIINKKEYTYNFGLELIKFIYIIAIKHFSQADYIDYFKCLDCDDSVVVKTISGQRQFADTINIRTIYKKIVVVINTIKTNQKEAIESIRDTYVKISKYITKNGNLSNIDGLKKLEQLKYIDQSDFFILKNLINSRNSTVYESIELQKKDITLIINGLEIMYKITKKLYPNTINKPVAFKYEYFPIDGAKVLFYLANNSKNDGQHLGTYYVVKEEDYGLQKSQIIRIYDKEKVDLIKHNNSGYHLIENDLNNEYYLIKKDLPIKSDIYEYVCYDIPENYNQIKYSIKFNVKQIEEIIYDVLCGLYNLTKLDVVIHHRNIGLDTVFYSVQSNGKARAKIGYFEHAKIKKEQVVTVYRDTIEKKNYFMPYEVIDNSSIDFDNYDWELYDVFSVGRLFIYLLFNNKENVNEDNFEDKLEKFNLDNRIKEILRLMISENIEKRPKLEQIVNVFKEVLSSEN